MKQLNLCNIVSDFLEYIDESKCAILILLDVSATFDIVDLKLLVEDLMYIGVEDMALDWFEIYLENRSYHVMINGKKSEKRLLLRGVSQGSVLGPVLFSIYTIKLAWILGYHGVQLKMSADDTQLYITIDNAENTIMPLNGVVHDLKEWMAKKKTEIKC